MRFLLVALVLTALLPASAAATTLATAGGELRPQPYQAWVDRAGVPTPPGVVTVRLTPCPELGAWAVGCASPAERAIHLAAGGRDRPTLLHELGHLFDALVLDEPDRRRFQAIIGRRGPWTGPPSADPPHEQFAEAYAACAQRPRARRTRLMMYGYVATPARHRRACGLIRSAAARRPA